MYVFLVNGWIIKSILFILGKKNNDIGMDN